MSILVSMPGRHGDILWALPTVRAISETYGESVDLLVSERYGSLVGLIQRQAYIKCVTADPAWDVRETAPMTPRVPPFDAREYDRVFHLGYEGWPEGNLAGDIYARAVRTYGSLHPMGDWQRPWITAPYTIEPSDLCVGFTDEHFELKFGLHQLLVDRFRFRAGKAVVNLSQSPRWNTEANWTVINPNWETSAAWLAGTKVFVGCCSALHVLAVAMGKPVVCVEPNPQRHQDVFYPLGKVGPVQLLLGSDGLPTVDSRHLGDAIEEKLA